MRNQCISQYAHHINKAQSRLLKFLDAPCELRSTGALIFDENDKPYLNCGGYGVFFLGHTHPSVIEPVSRQLHQHPLSCRSVINVEHAKAAEALLTIAPENLSRVFFTNTGAEAVEVALKIAHLNGKQRIISMRNGFHGKTQGALSVTGNASYRKDFLPLLNKVDFIDFGNIEAANAILSETGGDACLILEPIQGEAGVHIPPEGYLPALAELCKKTNTLLIIDEIQTGMGRVGYWWSSAHQGVTPDILLAGKGLGGGVIPVGAVMTTEIVFHQFNEDPLLHSSTFAANPLAMTAVQATIKTIKENLYLPKARELGLKLLKQLKQAVSPYPKNLIVDVRGQGLLLTIEFSAGHIAADFILELMQRHIITCHSLNNSQTVRFTPPVILSADQIQWLISAVKQSLEVLTQRYCKKAPLEGGN
tara:strand:+ start:154 stop:1413 length:1260 start_codon:yes stop_codon:yes gene_type:complete